MKPLKFLWLLVPLLVVAAIPSPQNLTFGWDYPPAEVTPDLVFKLYTSPSVSTPVWSLVKVVPGTNLQTTISVVPGVAFYQLTASNFWGESDPSNVVGTPPVPRQGVLRVNKGP